MLSAINQRMLNGQFALNDSVTTPRAFQNCGVLDTTHFVEWGVGVSSGEVTIEVADEVDYAGLWAPVAVLTFGARAALPYADYARIEGSYNAMRHRITSLIVDGTVVSKINGSL